MLTLSSFVIAVVEMMAAGLVTLAHRSGGPLMDIVVEEESSRNGFLASHDQVLSMGIINFLSRNVYSNIEFIKLFAAAVTNP